MNQSNMSAILLYKVDLIKLIINNYQDCCFYNWSILEAKGFQQTRKVSAASRKWMIMARFKVLLW